VTDWKEAVENLIALIVIAMAMVVIAGGPPTSVFSIRTKMSYISSTTKTV